MNKPAVPISLFENYLLEVNKLDTEHLPKDVSSKDIKPVYALNIKDVYSAFNKLDWAFADDDTNYLSHDIHPYPAKFPPQLPSQIIKLLSALGEIIWDPFGGSGTTALEALLCGRSCISTDINPVGSMVGKAKTTTLRSEDEQDLNRFIAKLEYYLTNTNCIGTFVKEHEIDISKEIPAIPNIEKWFSPTVICELSFLKYLIKTELKNEVARTIALASFSKIITRVSNQESETAYRAVKKDLNVGDSVSIFFRDFCLNYSKIRKLSTLIGYTTSSFITTDVMGKIVGVRKPIHPESVDLIVTSPPYPNAFDYHLYHRFRIFWLDGDPREMMNSEIGSHLKYQRQKTNFDQFESEMSPVMENCYKALKHGRYAVFVLGNAVFNGTEYNTAARISKLAQKIGFINAGIVNRPLPKNKRSVKNCARRAENEQILILKKPDRNMTVKLMPVNYRLWPYESEISNLERHALCNKNCDEFTVQSNFDTNIFKKLTFYKSFQINGSETATWQSILEHGDKNNESRRKDPKYLTHGIHPYKGKFYPQLVRPLLNISQCQPRSIVFDPFCGSGTVALESILNGFDAFGCDINPIAVEIAIAKNTIFKVTPYEFEKQMSLFKEELSEYDRRKKYDIAFHEDAITEIKSWFPLKVIAKMGFILTKISAVPDERIRCFLRVILSSIIREISQQDPSDLRIRRRKVSIDDAPVIEMYIANLDKQCENIMDFHKTSNNAPDGIGQATVWRGNSKNLEEVTSKLNDKKVDIVITSPPYATALPYIDTNRLNMLVLNGYSASKRVSLESEMTGTREIKKTVREFYENKIAKNDFSTIVSKTAKTVVKKIYAQNVSADVGFRKKNMAALLYMYFNDITKVMNVLDTVVKAKGYICIVIGDTKTTTGKEKVIIKTTDVLRETGASIGWNLIYDIPINVTLERYLHMSNSITENNILVFRKN